MITCAALPKVSRCRFIVLILLVSMAIARLSKIKSQVRVRAYENLKTGKDPERAFHLFNSQFKGVFTMLVA